MCRENANSFFHIVSMTDQFVHNIEMSHHQLGPLERASLSICDELRLYFVFVLLFFKSILLLLIHKHEFSPPLPSRIQDRPVVAAAAGQMRFALVGGSGFVGQSLTKSLSDQGYAVLVIDNVDQSPALRSGVLFRKASVTDEAAMRMALESFGATHVIHLASMGMSGSAMLSPLCKTVNVHGTSTLVDICVDLSIPHFIYTSSYNVVYGGKEIINGDESLPYFPLDKHTDQYGPTKALAEQLVLKANGRRLKNGGVFKTAAIRPAAIYGEEEQRHLPRIVKHIDIGLFQFKIGRAVVDWVDVDNLVHAFRLLADKLAGTGDASLEACGQAYCISDGTPVENFEFLRPLCEARGKKFPRITLPTSLLMHVAHATEIVYHVTNALGVPVEPFLTRAEVLKVGYSHHFSMAKAKRDLGYVPLTNSEQGAQKLARRFRRTLSNENYFDLPSAPWWISILLGMGLLSVVAYAEPHGALLKAPGLAQVNWLALTLFRSQPNLQYLLWAAVGTHALEAGAAMWLASVEGCRNTLWLWGAQTFVLGYPSMQLLYKRRALLQEVRAENEAAGQTAH